MPTDTYMDLLAHAQADIGLALQLLRDRRIPGFELGRNLAAAAWDELERSLQLAADIRIDHGTEFPKADTPEVPHAH